MRHRLIILAALAGGSAGLFAQKPAWQPAPGHLTLPLWPKGAPGAPSNPAPEADTTTAKDNLVAGKPLIRLGNVSVPTLTVYTPRHKNTGAAVVVFPGGGYHILAIYLEGTEVCDWLNSAGRLNFLRRHANRSSYHRLPAATGGRSFTAYITRPVSPERRR